jgi:hypothetical protein
MQFVATAKETLSLAFIRFGDNYRNFLYHNLRNALQGARELEKEMRKSELAFAQSLPASIGIYDVSGVGSSEYPEVYTRQQKFRADQVRYCELRAEVGEMEEELFPFAEDAEEYFQ